MPPIPVKRICLWSGPRNVSTALMYSFARRSDTTVVDEPLYGHYLRVTGAEQPGRDEFLRILETDGDRAVRETIFDSGIATPVFFIKNMAHHLVEIDETFLDDLVNVLLIRDPLQMLPSLVQQIPKPGMRDAAYRRQAELLDRLLDQGRNPPVLDSRELLLNPESVLRQLCDRVEIPFEDAMLSWAPGPHPQDGPWARFWYQNLHKSSGFAPYREKEEPFPDFLIPLLEECRSHYDFMVRHAIKGAP